MTTSRCQSAGLTTCRSRALAVGASVLAAALLMTPAAAGAAVKTGGALPTWPTSPDWQQYVEAPGSLNLTPVRVVSVSGTVTNPGGIVAGGHGDTTLTRSASDTGQTDIVLDYGRDIGGVPSFTVAAASGSPTMEAGYSEAAQYIAPGGDGGTPTIGANGDPNRADSYTVSGPGVITNRYIQGGERYQEISLTSAGSVSLSSAGIRYTAYDGTPRTYQGYFVSSDPTLNKEWYAGAYTLNLTQDLAGTQSHQWAVGNGAMNLTARSSFIGTPTNNGVLKFGGSWLPSPPGTLRQRAVAPRCPARPGRAARHGLINPRRGPDHGLNREINAHPHADRPGPAPYRPFRGPQAPGHRIQRQAVAEQLKQFASRWGTPPGPIARPGG